MANIAKMSISMGWAGQAAESGLSRVTKGLEKSGAAAKETGSIFGRLAQSLKGANDVKGFLDMAKGVFQYFVMAPINAGRALLEMGGQLETAQIRMAYLVGSWKEGTSVLEDLRASAGATGIPMDSLAKSFTELTSAGLSVGAVKDLLRDTATAAELLGSGASGADRLASVLVELSRSSIVSEASMQSLQSGGLKIYDALAARLSRISGQAVDTAQAMQMVKEGIVLSGTAIQAIQDASNTPQAQEAAKRFRSSFEGKLAEIKATGIQTFQDLGKSLIDSLNVTEILSAFKGGLAAIRDMVKEIAIAIGGMVDPLKKAGGIESSFRAARHLTFTIAETIAKSGSQFYAMIQEAANAIQTAAVQAKIAASSSLADWASGETRRKMQGAADLGEAGSRGIRKDAAGREKQIEVFFANLRASAAVADQAAKANQAVAAAGNAAAAALEANKKAATLWSDNVLKELATPLEKWKEAMGNVSLIAQQAAQAGVNITEALTRKAGAAMQTFLQQAEQPDAYQAGVAVKGSAAAAEAEIRAKFGPQTLGVQERIEQAIQSAKMVAERQLEIQQAQLAALARIPNPPAVLAFPKN